MNWNLTVKGPEKRDFGFSQKLALDFLVLAEVFGAHDSFVLTITEKYEDEEVSHYSMEFFFSIDDCRDDKNDNYAGLRARYKASANGEDHNGAVKVRVHTKRSDETNTILVRGAFTLYDKAVKDHYPEWTTDYVEQEEVETGKV